MKKNLLLLGLLLFTSSMVFCDPLTAVVFNGQKVLQDPKTKVIYYLESDLRHIAALSPDGKLLWCCKVIPATAAPRVHIISFGFYVKDDDLIGVTSNPVGLAWGIIHKKTGVYEGLGQD